jgi:hypothetical protein
MRCRDAAELEMEDAMQIAADGDAGNIPMVIHLAVII